MSVNLTREGSVTIVKPMGPIITGELDELDRRSRPPTDHQSGAPGHHRGPRLYGRQ